jgi:hypothetical protein
MSKLNIGVGEDFPLDDAQKNEAGEHPCAARWRARHMHRRGHFRRHGPGPLALVVLPAAAASVTAAILYPLATLAVIGGLGAAGALYRHNRHNHRNHGDTNTKPEDK